MSALRRATARFKKRRAPLCFLHVPKSAGTSVNAALKAALPDDAIAPRVTDTSIFCDFSDFDRFEEPARSLVAVGDAEVDDLGRHRIVNGHFALPTLERIAPAANIATVLREPRARVLSAFMYLRLTENLLTFWSPYGSEVLESSARTFEACLSESRIARSTDNQVCRLMLHGDARVPDAGFVAPSDAEGLAEATLEQLRRLGYVGILELDDIWGDMSRFFDVKLEPLRRNVSGEEGIREGSLPIPPFDMRVVLDLIEQRCEADRLVYETLVAERCGDRDEARRIADAEFAAALVRLGDKTGRSATKLYELHRQGISVN